MIVKVPDAQPFETTQDRYATVLGTRLCLTSYDELTRRCHALARRDQVAAIEFTNTHIVTLRRHDPAYSQLTACYDHFIPDATPLVWCLNRVGAGLGDRVYGPTFFRQCLTATTPDYRHYLLGGSPTCGDRLRAAIRDWNPSAQIVGTAHDRCLLDGTLEGSAEDRVLREIHQLSPHFIWVGLGTPKQDAWVSRHKSQLRHGVVLSVGFAFDVNAGMKPDAPLWMQRRGLTWLYRLASEPRRLAGRYLKYNSLFLWYLLWDGLRGKALEGPHIHTPCRSAVSPP
jgi:N-acetylglucosaminyldiphosphoundecaprenol N-acetyl-beta-D-mannosaminyltransferase